MLGKLHIELLVYPKVNSKHIDKLFPKSTIFMVNIIPGSLYGIGFATEVLLGFPQRLSTLRLASATAQPCQQRAQPREVAAEVGEDFYRAVGDHLPAGMAGVKPIVISGLRRWLVLWKYSINLHTAMQTQSSSLILWIVWPLCLDLDMENIWIHVVNGHKCFISHCHKCMCLCVFPKTWLGNVSRTLYCGKKNPKHDCQSTWLFSQTSYAFAHVQDDAPLWRQGTPEVFEIHESNPQ